MLLKPFLISLLFGLSNHAIAADININKAVAIQANYPLQKLTNNSFVVHASTQTPNADNQGFMNNVGIIITDAGVVVVDPGGTLQAGEWIIKKIAEKTKAPIVAVFNTHIHGDHWLGNQAIKAAYPAVKMYAHPNMITEASTEGKIWVANMLKWTDGASLGTKAVPPTHALNHGDEIKIGEKTFRIHHYNPAHTQSDIMIEVLEDKIVFLGDNVFYKRMSRMEDGHFAGNIAAIEKMLNLKLNHYVPGHGPSGDSSVAKNYQTYLKTIYQSVSHYYEAGLSDFEMKDKILPKLDQWQDWSGFDRQIGKHISRCYLEIEAAVF